MFKTFIDELTKNWADITIDKHQKKILTFE